MAFKVLRLTFKVETGPDREPVESIDYFRDAGVLGGLGDHACKRVLYSFQLFDMGIIYAAADYRIGHRYGSIEYSGLNVCEYV